MKNEEMIATLGRLGYPLFEAQQRKLIKAQIYEVLRELAASSETRFLEAFPVVLANCAHRGIELNEDDLLTAYSERSVKRKKLERLLLASADLLAQGGLEVPKGLGGIVERLRAKTCWHAGNWGSARVCPYHWSVFEIPSQGPRDLSGSPIRKRRTRCPILHRHVPIHLQEGQGPGRKIGVPRLLRRLRPPPSGDRRSIKVRHSSNR
jgi:hypothetical protein